MGTRAITRKDAREAARLLRLLQIHLESAIESAIAPGETEACAAIDAPGLAIDRVDFKSAEGIIRRFDIALGSRRRSLRSPRIGSAEKTEKEKGGTL